MTSVFREAVAKYWPWLLKTNESLPHASETANDDSFDPPASTLSRLLKFLESRGSIQYTVRLQQGDEKLWPFAGILQKLPGEPLPGVVTLTWNDQRSGIIKVDCGQIASSMPYSVCKNTNCLLSRKFYRSRSVPRGHKFFRGEWRPAQKYTSEETTNDLGCGFKFFWEFQRHNSPQVEVKTTINVFKFRINFWYWRNWTHLWKIRFCHTLTCYKEVAGDFVQVSTAACWISISE